MNEGAEVETQGDTFFVAFERAGDALAADPRYGASSGGWTGESRGEFPRSSMGSALTNWASESS